MGQAIRLPHVQYYTTTQGWSRKNITWPGHVPYKLPTIVYSHICVVAYLVIYMSFASFSTLNSSLYGFTEKLEPREEDILQHIGLGLTTMPAWMLDTPLVLCIVDVGITMLVLI